MVNGVINNLLWCLLVTRGRFYPPAPAPPPPMRPHARFLHLSNYNYVSFSPRFLSAALFVRSGTLLVEEIILNDVSRLVINVGTSTPRGRMMDFDPVGEGAFVWGLGGRGGIALEPLRRQMVICIYGEMKAPILCRRDNPIAWPFIRPP